MAAKRPHVPRSPEFKVLFEKIGIDLSEPVAEHPEGPQDGNGINSNSCSNMLDIKMLNDVKTHSQLEDVQFFPIPSLDVYQDLTSLRRVKRKRPSKMIPSKKRLDSLT